MIQTTLTVPLEVKPESAARLSSLINDFKNREDQPPPGEEANFARLITQLPMLHFMSMSVFEDRAYDPIFIIEANFDGPPGPFWTQLEALAGDTLREMLRCCKMPLDTDGALYQSVTKAGSGAPIAAYLAARTQGPSVFHHGNRGLLRDQILNDAKLFRAIRAELDAPENQGPAPYRGAAPDAFHKRLRDRLVPEHSWLNDPVPDRIPPRQKFGDFWHLMVFISLVLLAFAVPGILAVTILGPKIYLTIVIGLAAVVTGFIVLLSKPLKDTEVKTDFSLVGFLIGAIPTILGILIPPVLFLVAIGIGFVAVLDTVFDVLAGGVLDWWKVVASTILYGLISLILTVPFVVLWLRFLETRDSSQSVPYIDADKMLDMATNEDWVTQNHMGSIVHIRPGVLRTIIVRAGHHGLGLLLRIIARDGYLGSMRTVHFAHWAFLNNGSRLLFLSNYDQSWGAYLDDFIEKAHVGLTLAWGCGVGFPTTRFLIFDGASHGRRFKNWALASRTTSRFWYSAYRDLSVDQIERNHAISTGLGRQDMDTKDLLEWMRKL